MAENQAKSTPARVLFLFAFLMAGMAAALWRESNGGVKDSIDYPTALGDEQFCPIALLQTGQNFTAVMDKETQLVSWTITSKAAVAKREERLWKMGVASEAGFYVYQSDQAEDTGTWIKSAPGLFYRITRS
jgi:hypothetical protein